MISALGRFQFTLSCECHGRWAFEEKQPTADKKLF